MRRSLAVTAALAILSCADPLSPASSDIVRVNVLPDALELENTSALPVYFFAAERNSLELINWAPPGSGPTGFQPDSIRATVVQLHIH